MPRCYMVKKGNQRHEGPPPCSPTEASVAPPCYSPTEHSALTGPRVAEYAAHTHAPLERAPIPVGGPISVGEQIQERGSILEGILERGPGWGSIQDGGPIQQRGPAPAWNQVPEPGQILEEGMKRVPVPILEPEALPVWVPVSEPVPVPIQIGGMKQELEPMANRGLLPDHGPVQERRSELDREPILEQEPVQEQRPISESGMLQEPIPERENMPEGGYMPERGHMPEMILMSERSAADTEAAHDLLSLSQGLPPMPPPVVTVLHAPDPTPLVPVYTYTIQPTNIYIIAEEPHDAVYHTVQTAPSLQPLEYAIEPISYVEYQPPPPTETINYHVENSVLVPIPRQEVESESTQEVSSTLPDSEPELEIQEEIQPKGKVVKYDCNECGKRYATSSNLSRHKQTHRSLDSLAAKRCGVCGKAYVSMPALAMHVLTHRMGHVCGVCGKQFSRPWLLRGHLRSHTGEKPYSCASCGKAFADRSNLRAHLQTHSSDKKYECARCSKSFALRSYLNKHQESACSRSDDE